MPVCLWYNNSRMEEKDYTVFTCPQCGSRELLRFDNVVYKMKAGIDQVSGDVCGYGSEEEVERLEPTYKCAKCGKPFTKEEVCSNVSRIKVPQDVPRVVVDYELYTDGDYGLSNPAKWGAVFCEDDVDYRGRVEFTGDTLDAMRRKAKNFLWEMLTGGSGLHFGARNHDLMLSFYQMFESLTKRMESLSKKKLAVGEELHGNQEGTTFEVRLEGF